jgi:hypothetical protein
MKRPRFHPFVNPQCLDLREGGCLINRDCPNFVAALGASGMGTAAMGHDHYSLCLDGDCDLPLVFHLASRVSRPDAPFAQRLLFIDVHATSAIELPDSGNVLSREQSPFRFAAHSIAGTLNTSFRTGQEKVRN